jgi:putative flippase GtrA
MKMMSLVVKYALFAGIATGVNLGSQYITLGLYNGYMSLQAAIVMGTGTGLLAKYYLDKKYIFYYRVDGIKGDFHKFILYTLMGVVTTLIFWGFEMGFDHLFGTPWAKYAGAVIGLGIGYVTKYNLDKKFVFTTATPGNG